MADTDHFYVSLANQNPLTINIMRYWAGGTAEPASRCVVGDKKALLAKLRELSREARVETSYSLYSGQDVPSRIARKFAVGQFVKAARELVREEVGRGRITIPQGTIGTVTRTDPRYFPNWYVVRWNGFGGASFAVDSPDLEA